MTFQFRPVLTIFAALGMAILIALGVWQVQRRAWKLDLIAKTEARLDADPIDFSDALARADKGEDMEYRPVKQAGVYDHQHEAGVFGTLDGAAGGYIFTPLEVLEAGEGPRYVYINRGFVPQRLIAAENRADGQIAGDVTVTGLFRAAEHPTAMERMVRPADQPADNLWFTRDPQKLAAAAGIEAPAYYIDSNGAENTAASPKGGTTRLEFNNRHLEYALTWFGLAAALLAVFIASSVKRR